MARLLTIAFLLCASSAAGAAGTLIVRNVDGYALTPTSVKPFGAMIVVDGKVTRLIDRKDKVPEMPGATVIDGGGRSLLPGLIDAHGHVLSEAQERDQADLRGTQSVAEAQQRIREFARQRADRAWIVGRGWNQVLWPERRFPTAQELDAALSDRPAVMGRIDGHAIWVNSAALKIAGITAQTPDPAGGQILRDAAGSPNGVFVDAAMSLIEQHLPAASDADVEHDLGNAIGELASLGLTGVHDAGIDMQQYRAYLQLGEQHRLAIRIYAMLLDSPAARATIAAGPMRSQFDDKLQMRAVKAILDGALGSRGAALSKDYSDQPGHRGLLLYTPAQFDELLRLTASRGWQLNVHAIGDGANHLALDAFEKDMSAGQRRDLRPRIEHAQVIALADIPRFAALGVIPSMQPTHATSDKNMAELRIGPERLKGAYAWRKLMRAGSRIAGGSDFPVELPNPFHGLYAAVTRMDRDGQPPGGWHAEESLTREEALRLFTVNAAFAAHLEGKVGSLMPGEYADFILVDRDYFKVPPDQIDDIQVVATYVAGERVYSAKP